MPKDYENLGNPGDEEEEAVEGLEEEEEEVPAEGGEEELFEGGEELPEEGGEAAHASLEEGASALVAQWAPETPEGEQYKSELQALVDQFAGGGEMGEMGEMGMEEEMPPIEAGPIGDMRNAAVERLKARGMV